MIKILANDGIEADGVLLLEAAGYQVDTNHIPQAELPTKLQDYQVIIVRSATTVRKELIDACPNLKIIARGGVGMDNIDVAYAKEKGIQVINTPAASSQSVAELVFAHLLSVARFVHLSNRQLTAPDANFKKLKAAYGEGIQLRGRTIGIIGFGRIGKDVARIAIAMGMDVLAYDPFVKEAELTLNIFQSKHAALTIKLQTVTLEELIKNADFITLHVPGSGKAVLGEAEIAQMKDGVVLINCARGGVIDEDALLSGLASGKIAAAGLDTFVGEPAPRPELISHPKISVTPHIGAATKQAQANIGLELADKIISHFGENK
jgi:D-3-phosphoglycerate dehydrogenase / 2-oxoglutarate reductase